jgi:hypothetical protein
MLLVGRLLGKDVGDELLGTADGDKLGDELEGMLLGV